MRIRDRPKPLVMRMKAPWSEGVTTDIGGKTVDMAIPSLRSMKPGPGVAHAGDPPAGKKELYEVDRM